MKQSHIILIAPIFVLYFCQRVSISYCLILIHDPPWSLKTFFPASRLLVHRSICPSSLVTLKLPSPRQTLLPLWSPLAVSSPLLPLPTVLAVPHSSGVSCHPSIFHGLVVSVSPTWQGVPWGQGQSSIPHYILSKRLLHQIQSFVFICKNNVKLYSYCTRRVTLICYR